MRVQIPSWPPCPHNSVEECRLDEPDAQVRLLVRVPSSHGETEIMTDYEFVVGGSSPPGSANGKAPRASVAEWTIAPGCKPGPTGTVVRIHPGAPSFHGPVDRTPVSGTGDRRFEPCWERGGPHDRVAEVAVCKTAHGGSIPPAVSQWCSAVGSSCCQGAGRVEAAPVTTSDGEVAGSSPVYLGRPGCVAQLAERLNPVCIPTFARHPAA